MTARQGFIMATPVAIRANPEALFSLVSTGRTVVKADFDKLMQKVHEEDKVLVGNVIRTMQVLRTHDFVYNFEVVPNVKGYDVIGTLAKSFDRELILTSADFEIIQSVSPARINTVMVQVSNKALELVVRVFSHNTPLSFSTVQISHINKKTRWF
ncbi:hypothetical protein T484DRAFT_1758163 [Baffinella frigidus]|nr:hypothetical protein T484DRAFT_1758163 [Cryptophyta sp. CCMP2293]